MQKNDNAVLTTISAFIVVETADCKRAAASKTKARTAQVQVLDKDGSKKA